MSFFPKMLSGLPVVYFNSALEYLCLNFKDSFALKRNLLDHPCGAATDRGSTLFWELQLGILPLGTATPPGLQDRGSSGWGGLLGGGSPGWRVFWMEGLLGLGLLGGGLLGWGLLGEGSYGWRVFCVCGSSGWGVRWPTSLALLHHRGCRKKALIWGHR